MVNIKLVVAIGVVAATLAGCNGRVDPDWSFGNPSCAPDGSVVFYEYPNANGSYDGLKNSPANCSWNKKT